MNLDRVMCKFEDSGLTLNYDKCVIGTTSMTYMGEVLALLERGYGYQTKGWKP